MIRSTLLATLTLLLATWGPRAVGDRLHPTTTPAVQVVASGTNPCADGLVYDDETFEELHGGLLTGTPQGPPIFGTVMRLDPPAGATRLERVCLCWARDLSDFNLFHDLVVYDIAPGTGGPGNELWRGSFELFQVSQNPTFFSYELRSEGIAVPPQGFYVGATWAPLEADLRFCEDQEGPASRPKYFTVDDGSLWTSFDFLLPGP